METAASSEVRNAPSSYPAIRASILAKVDPPALTVGADIPALQLNVSESSPSPHRRIEVA